MYKKTFHGGVHPYDGKEFARDIPFQTWLPKGDLVFHLNQHIGSRQNHWFKKETVYWRDRSSQKRMALYQLTLSVLFPEP